MNIVAVIFVFMTTSTSHYMLRLSLDLLKKCPISMYMDKFPSSGKSNLKIMTISCNVYVLHFFRVLVFHNLIATSFR